MHRYHFNVKIDRKYNNAGSKATEDCKSILLKTGSKDLEISFIKVWYLMPFNLIKLLLTLACYLVTIHPRSLFVVQYPLQGINPYFKYYIKLLKRKGCFVACIIHDLDSIRSVYDKRKIDNEIEALFAYDAIISHNTVMTEWLQCNGYKGFISEIFLFDYLLQKGINKVDKTGNEKQQIAFAGNLGRGNFLPQLSKLKTRFCLNLYGSGLNKEVLDNNSNIRWLGTFSPTEIVNEISGDFGLVWDGESVEDLEGLMGEYLKYNTPHKTSLYLTAGLPVIVPKKAAIAEYVETNNIGICVDNLIEISERVAEVEDGMYRKMKENVRLTGEKLQKGYYLSKALSRIENHFITANC